jgi:hypothetical protein
MLSQFADERDRRSRKLVRLHVMDSQFQVTCPTVARRSSIYLEPEIRGTLVQDCEVCCNPWQLRISTDGGRAVRRGHSGGWVGVTPKSTTLRLEIH